MKKYVVEIVEKITYKVEYSDITPECAERLAREMYDIADILKAQASWIVFRLM